MTASDSLPMAEENAQRAKNALSASLIFSGIRCVLMYAVFPFVLPLVGLTGAFANQLDIVVNVIAIGAIFYSVRRFWKIDYHGKVVYTVIAGVALVLIALFIALDLRALGIIDFTL